MTLPGSSATRRRRTALAVAAVLLAALAVACDTLPILRGSGSEHRQAIRVGLPF
jgi:hypothetical protein